MRFLILTFTLIFTFPQFGISQCNPNPNPAEQFNCQDAVLLCCGEFDGITGTLPFDPNPSGPAPLCPGTSTVANNMVWYAFVAGSTSMTYEMIFTNCIPGGNGNGVQVGIYADCSFSEVVFCNGGQNTALLPVALNNLTIGNVYYIFLDGFAGAVCDYEINLIQGVTMEVDPEPLTGISGPVEACENATNTIYTADPTFGVSFVEWTVSNPTVQFGSFGNDINILDWGNATGSTVQICGIGLNDCNPTPSGQAQFCINVDVTASQNFNEVGSYCSGEPGYLFPLNGQIYAEGMHSIFVDNGGTCPDHYELTVEVIPAQMVSETRLIDNGEVFILEGISYIGPFFETFNLTTPDTNGCFNIMTLNLLVPDPNPFISTIDSVLTCQNPQAILIGNHLPNNELTFAYDWTTVDGCILGPSNAITTVVGCTGTYTLTIFTSGPDGMGGIRTIQKSTTILVQEEPSFTLDFTSSNVSCIADGSITVTPSGGVPPYEYNWSPNGETTNEITNLPPGIYTVVVTDDTGCQVVGSQEILSIIDLSLSSTFASCDQNDGTATATILGGADTPSFEWNNGQSTATATGLAPDWYSVTVTDDMNGCQTHENIQVIEDPACSVVISGFAVVDEVNMDCLRDPSSVNLSQILIELSDGQLVYTNANGFYSFIAEPGSYDITATLFSNGVEQTCDDILNIDASQMGTTYEENNFFFDYVPTVDVRLKIVKPNARPGFTQQVRICLMNVGGTAASGTLTMVHPDVMNFIDANPNQTGYSTADKLVTWEYTDLPPGAIWIYYPRLMVPVDVPIGTDLPYVFEATTSPGLDINPDDNIKACTIQVTGSYDPNDKAVDPAGTGPEGFIGVEDTTLSYTIQFQNTGNDTAFTVMLRDTLSEFVDARTLSPGASSHNYEARIINGNVLEVLYENIMLPDSFVNEPGSNGFFVYDIEVKRNLDPLTEIKNRAGIYFDFNEPIITNTTLNTIEEIVSIPEVVDPIAFELTPNPTSGNIQLQFAIESSEVISISLIDLLGENIAVLQGASQMPSGKYSLSFNIGDLAQGVYFVNIRGENGRLSSRKLVKL